ncbi:hypothetical protein DL767_008855 [Monosporascus sp. MG133]|nr:hypothetical protein DL767_008855 [Monosporascus sp. MG133]
MIGCETALRTGCGEIMKVRGRQMAPRALGTTERITMVTSFRPRCQRCCRRTRSSRISSRYSFFAEQERFLACMNPGIVDDGDIVMGSIDGSHLLTTSGAKVDDTKVKKCVRVV